MTLDEALKVLNSVRNDAYPPTNLYVLLEAAQVIYQNAATADVRSGIGDILTWAQSVFATNG